MYRSIFCKIYIYIEKKKNFKFMYIYAFIIIIILRTKLKIHVCLLIEQILFFFTCEKKNNNACYLKFKKKT